MKKQFSSILKYLLVIGLMAFILWWVFNSIDLFPDDDLKKGTTLEKLNFIIAKWGKANKWWLFLSAVIAVLSHVSRAERWRLQLRPLGYNVSLKNSFLAVINSYFVNLAIPRGGEVSRPVMLKKLEKVPTATSFGTILSERIIDLFFLVLLMGIVVVFQLTRFRLFFDNYLNEVKKNDVPTDDHYYVYIIGLGSVVGLIIFILFFRKTELFAKIKAKLITFWENLRDGIKSVKNIENKNWFIFHSIAIWLMYYLMLYTGLLAFNITSHLGPLEALTVFVAGGIAMAAPLPGGTGSFHAVIPVVLVYLCGIEDEGGKNTLAFTVIYHEWHSFVVIIVGGISLIFSQIGIKKQKATSNPQ